MDIEFWAIIILIIALVGMTCWCMVLDTKISQLKGYIKRCGWERR